MSTGIGCSIVLTKTDTIGSFRSTYLMTRRRMIQRYSMKCMRRYLGLQG